MLILERRQKMNSNARLYKTLSSEELASLKLKIDRKYSYCTESDVKELKEQAFEGNNSNSKVFQLVDEDYEWDPKVHSLFLDIVLSIKNPSIIFGKNGSCYEDAVIGVGLTWKSEKSKIKNCIKLGEITKTSNSLEFVKSAIELENLSSNATFRLIFYIVKPGTKNGNKFFANQAGMVILDQIAWTIIVEGESSIFPIYEVADDNGPLWSFSCDFYDITDDLFDKEHVKVLINTRHPAYAMVNLKSPQFNEMFMNEIMSNAVAAIIVAIRDKLPNNHVDLSLDCENGSILQALKYFKDKLDFDINGSLESLTNSIKKFFDKEGSL